MIVAICNIGVRATDSPFTGDGITVAVLDTGIDPNHPAFRGVNHVRKNFTTEGDDDQHGHGMHCAEAIFGPDVGGQRIGVARGVQRALIGKVLGQGGGSSATIAKAIQWAVMNGTSMATPHAAGVAALWAHTLPLATGRVESQTLIAQLVARADTAPLAPGFEEDDVGTGIVQAPLS